MLSSHQVLRGTRCAPSGRMNRLRIIPAALVCRLLLQSRARSGLWWMDGC